MRMHEPHPRACAVCAFKEMIMRGDLDKDGKISPDEFYKIMTYGSKKD